MHRAVWTRSEGRVTATSVWLAVPVSERGPTLHPVRSEGGCGKECAFHAVLVVDRFRMLESNFIMAIKHATRHESHSLGQK